MVTEKQRGEYYQALLERDASYEGIFVVGVKTTHVFCRPTCPARKPKLEHCEFFDTAKQALLASYRPCKRCRPLSHPNQVSESVRRLVEAVEQQPDRRWKDRDFRALGVDSSTARRQFKKRFGMTFVEYARARRMGIGMNQIRNGDPIIQAQLASGYDSGSGFRDAFSRIMGKAPSKVGQEPIVLKASWLDTPLGPMLAVASEQALYLLEFVDRRGLEREIERMRKRLSCAIIPGKAGPILSIEGELKRYFEGNLTVFETPVAFLGSPFQTEVWKELRKIPPGQTCSYTDLARAVGRPSAVRAVASANGANQLALIIPCHRVINLNGSLGGYGGGIARKKWLLDHESA